ncbi:MAG: B12-binding domain-containing radical SAM protein [Candidatus Aenigmarchaeota archaeon]|nr:B12-binding domain-containing radical SAM protein [Candidatus Aenigmarchaeota archaeon]
MEQLLLTGEVEAKAAILSKIREIFGGKRVSKVLLVNPPDIASEEFNFGAALQKRCYAYPPYGPMLLADVLRKSGYEPEIVDLNYHVIKSAVESGGKMDYDAEWKGLLARKIDEFKPDAVGITCMFTMTHDSFVRVCSEVAGRELPIIVGGVHVSNDTERVLRSINYEKLIACSYESEVAFQKLLETTNGHGDELYQVSVISGGKYYSLEERKAPEPDDLNRIPAYELVDISNYSSVGTIGSFTALLEPGTRVATVLSNKGCRAMCTFCSVRSFNGMGVRQRSVESVADEIELLARKYGVKHIMWLDDDLFFNEKRTIELFQEIKRRNLGITWDASNGVIAAACKPGIIEAAAESGCIGMFFGIESGNPKILLDIKKPGTVDNFRNAASLLRKYPKIFSRGFLMLGFPHESLGMMLDTMNLALELDLDWYALNILQPLPSTPIYKAMVKEGLIEDKLQTKETRFMIGPHGKQNTVEHKKEVKKFINSFESGDLDAEPTSEQLMDIWFYMNYKINYERVMNIKERERLLKIVKQMRYICDVVTSGHALANMTLAACELNAGNIEDAKRRMELVEKQLMESEYWRDKFEAFGLYSRLYEIKSSLKSDIPLFSNSG